jgi:MarR family transcriptional regulator, organic hydroperoxide resistance regulator
MASTVRDMFPFGDVDAAVLGRAASRFEMAPVDSVLAGFALGRSVIDLLDTLLSILDDFGLSPARWRLMVALMFQSAESGATIGELATHLGVKEPTVTATVDRLQQEDLVRRTRDAGDQRKVRVSLTPAAWALAARVIPVMSTQTEALVESLGGPEDVTDMARRISDAVGRLRERQA